CRSSGPKPSGNRPASAPGPSCSTARPSRGGARGGWPATTHWSWAAGCGGAGVGTSAAAICLGACSWSPLPASHLFVTDPGGVVWAGCETSGGCRATDADTVKSHPQAIQVSERIDRPTGSWAVTWVASTQAIVNREQWLLSRIVLAAIAAALV